MNIEMLKMYIEFMDENDLCNRSVLMENLAHTWRVANDSPDIDTDTIIEFLSGEFGGAWLEHISEKWDIN